MDRFYMSTGLIARKSGIEIIPAAFSDHHALVLRIIIPDYELRRRRSRWKMDPMLMQDESIRAKIRNGELAAFKRHFPDVAQWWEPYVKKHLQRLVRQEETELRRNHRLMENHLYKCLYDILRNDAPETEKLPALQRYKAKMVRLHATRRAKPLLDLNDRGKMDGEKPSLFHILKCSDAGKSHKYRLPGQYLHQTHQLYRAFLWHTCVRNMDRLTRTYNPWPPYWIS
jgi:hypothetical protein